MLYDNQWFFEYNAAVIQLIKKKFKKDLFFGWSGTAGIFLTDNKKLLFIDPFVSYPSIIKVIFSKLHFDRHRIRKYTEKLRLYSPDLSAVLISHSHYDHILDAPGFIEEGFQNFYGSSSAARVLHSIRPDQPFNILQNKKKFRIGSFTITPVLSKHGDAVFGRQMYTGEIADEFKYPARASKFNMGEVYSFFIEYKGINIVHHGSAGCIPKMYEGRKTDILFLGIAGWQYSDCIFDQIIQSLDPEIVVPIHYDNMFAPHPDYEKPFNPDPLINLKIRSFLEKMKKDFSHIRVVSVFPHQLIPVAGRV